MKIDTVSYRYQEPAKIWNKSFISIFFANMVMNLGQMMSNSLLAKYADSFGAPASSIGMLMSTFAISALLFKIVSAPAMDTYNRKYLASGSMLILAISYFGYSMSNTIPLLMVFRLVQGFGVAFGNVCCLAIVAEILPKEKYGTGIGYYSLATVVSQAIGPSVGLALVGLAGYQITYLISMSIMLFASFLALRIKLDFKRTKKLKIVLNNIIAKEALLPAVVLLFLAMAVNIISSFLIVYAGKRGVTNIGLYFTVFAVTMIFTRPAVGKLTDRYGLVRVFVPALFCDVIAFIIISFSHTLLIFLLAAFISAFGFGACQPALQALTMKSVTNERRGAGSSTNYVGTDIGTLLGPAIAGSIAQAFGYETMWRIMIVPLLIAIAIVIIFHSKIASIERNFKVRNL